MKLETLDMIWKEYLAHYPDAEILRLEKVMKVLKAANAGDYWDVPSYPGLASALEELEKE